MKIIKTNAKNILKYCKVIAIILLVFVFSIFVVLGCRTYSDKIISTAKCFSSGSDQKLQDLVISEFKSLKFNGQLVIANQKTIFAKIVCGFSDIRAMSPISNKTLFNIGSVTKQFTGYVILELISEGRLSWDASILNYIPELKDFPIGKATVRQLVEMRSGLPYMFSNADFIKVQLTKKIYSSDELIKQIQKLTLISAPGEKFEYSNPGYILLGLLVGRIEGSDWATVVKKRIFEPFGMNHSTVEGEISDPPKNLASGIFPWSFFSHTFFLELFHWNYSMIKGAGGIVSNVDDLHRWNIGLSKKISSIREWSIQYFPNGILNAENYRHGWIWSSSSLKTGKNIPTLNHAGEDPGYCAFNIRLPEKDIHISAVFNIDYCALNEKATRPLVHEIFNFIENNKL